jgi:hypothetical protein
MHRASPVDHLSMFDADVVDLCARCMADVAAHGDEEDFALSAVAFARDITDAFPGAEAELRAVAAAEAIAYLDASDVDAPALALGLRRLVALRSPPRGAQLRPGVSERSSSSA